MVINMKRVVFSLLLCLMAGCFVACGDEGIKSVDGKIVINGKVTELTEWSGTDARHKVADNFEINYYQCSGPLDDCVHNTARVAKEDMDRYKKSYYYALYLRTQVYVMRPDGKKFKEGFGIISAPDDYQLEYMVKVMYEDLSNLVFDFNVKTVGFNNVVNVNVDGLNFAVRQNEVVIPGLLRVTADSETHPEAADVLLGAKAAKMYSTNRYNYYLVDGVSIQIIKDDDVMKYISFVE